MSKSTIIEIILKNLSNCSVLNNWYCWWSPCVGIQLTSSLIVTSWVEVSSPLQRSSALSEVGCQCPVFIEASVQDGQHTEIPVTPQAWRTPRVYPGEEPRMSTLLTLHLWLWCTPQMVSWCALSQAYYSNLDGPDAWLHFCFFQGTKGWVFTYTV